MLLNGKPWKESQRFAAKAQIKTILRVNILLLLGPFFTSFLTFLNIFKCLRHSSHEPWLSFLFFFSMYTNNMRRKVSQPKWKLVWEIKSFVLFLFDHKMVSLLPLSKLFLLHLKQLSWSVIVCVLKNQSWASCDAYFASLPFIRTLI